MGEQACVFYGGAEFSRDCDIVILVNAINLNKLDLALDELQAQCIAVPDKNWKYLDRGHAIHFRCKHPDAVDMRLDVMSKMRGCDDFPLLWERRTTIEDESGFKYEVIGIEDLVKAKKTQREKDWPMIRRLVDSHYAEFCDAPNQDQIQFWFRESRSPEVLMALAKQYPKLLDESMKQRSLLIDAKTENQEALHESLDLERKAEMQQDYQYWQPLIKELEPFECNAVENRLPKTVAFKTNVVNWRSIDPARPTRQLGGDSRLQCFSGCRTFGKLAFRGPTNR